LQKLKEVDWLHESDGTFFTPNLWKCQNIKDSMSFLIFDTDMENKLDPKNQKLKNQKKNIIIQLYSASWQTSPWEKICTLKIVFFKL